MTADDRFMNNLIYAAILAVMALRLAVIGISPLGLDVEEAQYWQWSTTPDLGYFTKPPMIAWVISVGTFIFGDTAFGVRFMAPLIQAVSAIIFMKIGQSVHSQAAGRIAAIIWLTLPISALGGQIISTDSPMLLFLLAALLVLTPLARLEIIDVKAAGLAGIFTGLGMMAKYAAIYLPAGLILWWLWEGRRHQILSWSHLWAYIAGICLSLLPNFVWNLNNGFVTARHLSHNANLDEASYSIMGSLEFLMAQMGVVGPVVFIISIIVLISCRNDRLSRYWIALFVPAIVVISVQGFFADANANWAVASWPPALMLTAVYCAEHGQRLRQYLLSGIGVNTGLMMIVIIVAMLGSLGPLTPASDPLRRLKAWDMHAQDIAEFAATHNADTVVVMRRGFAAKLIWELRERQLAVLIIDQNGIPENHFEKTFPWVPKKDRVSIFINGELSPPELASTAGRGNVRWHGITAVSSYSISKNRDRTLILHLGTEQ